MDKLLKDKLKESSPTTATHPPKQNPHKRKREDGGSNDREKIRVIDCDAGDNKEQASNYDGLVNAVYDKLSAWFDSVPGSKPSCSSARPAKLPPYRKSVRQDSPSLVIRSTPSTQKVFEDYHELISAVQAEDAIKCMSEHVAPISQDNHWGDTHLIYLDTVSNGIRFKTLMDTGARPSVISESLLKKIGFSHLVVPTSWSASAANNSELAILGQVTIPLEFSNSLCSVAQMNYEWTGMFKECNNLVEPSEPLLKKFKVSVQHNSPVNFAITHGNTHFVTFLVAKELATDAIMGMATLRMLRTFVDLVNGFIFIGKQAFDYLGKTPRLSTSREVAILPNRGVRVELNAINIPDGNVCVRDCIPVPTVGMEHEDAIISVVDGKAYITIENHSDEVVRLSPNSEVVQIVDNYEDQITTDLGPIHINPDLSKTQQKRLERLVRKFTGIMRNKLAADNYVNSTHHVIRVRPGAKPVRRRVPFFPPVKQKVIEETVRDLLQRDMIEPGECEWRAPLLVVPKKDGGWRTVIDYRGLNAETIPDSYPMPLINEVLCRLSNAKFFTKMDLTEGFWHIRMAKESKELTGFAVKGGSYVWKRMPMGLKNAPATFQRLMDEVLGEFSDFCQPYIDDIIIFSEDFDSHLEHVSKVLHRLHERGLVIKLPKCEFCVEKVEFLGHVVSAQGIQMQPRKIDAIVRLAVPRNEAEVKRFINMAGYYRKFIKDFSQRTYHLGEIARGKDKFAWTVDHQREFEDIKQALTSDPVMAYPDWNREFILSTDASIQGLGAVLSQMFPEGERVIAYASRRLKDSEKNYGITQLEALAVVWATELFREPYLITKRFTLRTDHRALLKLQNLTPNSNRMLERWSMKLTDYDMNIVYRPGPTMVMVDPLSRAPVNVIDLKKHFEDLPFLQQQDSYWSRIYKKLVRMALEKEHSEVEVKARIDKDGKLSAKHPEVAYWIHKGKPSWQKFWIDEQGILRQDLMIRNTAVSRVCLPKALVPTVLQVYHEDGHWGALNTFRHLQTKFVWPGMHRDTDIFCQTCETCQKCNKHTKNVGRMSYLPVYERNELIGIDTFSGIPKSNLGTGNSAILVVTDFLTRFTWLIPVPDTKAVTVARALLTTWCSVFGCPKKIISDKGRDNAEFNNQICQELYQLCGIDKLSSVGYHPEAMGTVERFNRTMVAFLQKNCLEQADWEAKLPALMWQYNSTLHAVTRQPPAFLMFGYMPRTPLEMETDLNTKEKFSQEKWIKSGIPMLMECIREARERSHKMQIENAEKFNESNKLRLRNSISVGMKVLEL